MRRAIIILVGFLALTSCATKRISTASSIDIDTKVSNYPTIVDLDVSEVQVSKEMSWTYIDWILSKIPDSQRCQNIVSDLLKEVGADILIEERIETYKDFFGRRTICVSGFPAKFKNFRTATPEEIETISLVNVKYRCGSECYIIER